MLTFSACLAAERVRKDVLLDLIPAALAVGVAPGWFWANLLSSPMDQAERLALSVTFSMSLVPP